MTNVIKSKPILPSEHLFIDQIVKHNKMDPRNIVEKIKTNTDYIVCVVNGNDHYKFTLPILPTPKPKRKPATSKRKPTRKKKRTSVKMDFDLVDHIIRLAVIAFILLFFYCWVTGGN